MSTLLDDFIGRDVRVQTARACAEGVLMAVDDEWLKVRTHGFFYSGTLRIDTTVETVLIWKRGAMVTTVTGQKARVKKG